FHGMQVRYQHLLHSSMETRGVTLTFGVQVLLLIPVLLMFTRSELAPSEDQSFVFMLTNAPQTANLEYLTQYTNEVNQRLREFDEYEAHFHINGMDGVNSGLGGVILKPWDQRERS